MLAGCSSLLSPRHRLRSDQACHFQLQEKLYPCSMNTQRLDLPRSFSRKEAPPRTAQSSRPVSISIDKTVETKPNCGLRQSIRIPSPITAAAQTSAFWEGRRDIEDGYWEKGKNRGRSLKRDYSERSSSEESCINRAKRKRSNSKNPTPDDSSEEEGLGLNQLGFEDFWLSQFVQDPRSMLGIESFDPTPVPFPTSSAEEERVRFVPTRETFPPPLPPSSKKWVVTETTDKGEKDVGPSEEPKKSKSSSSASSETHSLALKQAENSSDNEAGNGSQIPYSMGVTGGENIVTESQSLEILNLLVGCVDSIQTKNPVTVNQFLYRLGELASPEGTPIQRVVAYFTEGLALRTAKLWPHIFRVTAPRDLEQADEAVATAFRLLNHISPIPKFLHFTSNEIMLRAFEGKDRVHIIDFDIKQGLQWSGLFQSLASRPDPPSHVRITGIGESKQELQNTGERLAVFAEALNLPFEFHPVVDRLEDVRLWMLHVKEKECVAVNCILQLHKVLYDGNGGAFRDLLGLIRSTNPTIVLMGEQEAEHNEPIWEKRVSNSLKYYSAIFDSIDSTLSLDSPARIKVEEMFGKEIKNIVACEGIERDERHESFQKWRILMEDRGFRCVGIRERETLQSQMLLRMFSSQNYSVAKQGEEGGGLTLRWSGQPLYTVSAWAPIDFAGSSSSFSQPS